MSELWKHVDRDGDKGTLSHANENELRLWSTQNGSDLDRDAAERLITALAEHFRIPQLVICGEPKPDLSAVCARWPGHDGQHAGRGDRSNTHPTWIVWGGGGVLGQCDQIPGHDGRHNTPVCGEGFTHLGRQETCDMVAGHIGGHQRIGLRTDPQPEPEPEVSVQDRIRKEHAVDRAHYTSQFNTLMVLLRTQTGRMECQSNALDRIGDLLPDALGDVTRLLTEIRDRLPAPPPPQCGDASPYGGADCVQPRGHSGKHDSAAQA